ncbi:Hypothetical Protein FCC1311_058652 [Hondaea fermentalgiana]|uniref:N-acetyltransferase domain-containing protein n=1 Tax=Hondaea fermentalgiana TaxID=2315210 RepID=A0A2R5GP43_9STRA|nr:Hypothetical Protein FCC1311_058652 [Hondaea fermentalgiana]|eukprot:GBG29644.1 Hypothetical Protein FCC1311_058652 [Hondaea fermentalgiana]
MRRGLGAACAALLAWLLARKLQRAWRDQLVLADLVVGRQVGLDQGETELHRAMPAPVRRDVARIFAALFTHNALYAFLYCGPERWRRRMLEDLFEVQLRLNEAYGRSRYFVDCEDRDERSRVPRATCLASVYSTRDARPGVFDVVEAGGIPYFVKLGLTGFLRNYKFEQWLERLKASSAPKRDYLCVEHFFVRGASQGQGLAAAMLDKLAEEAEEASLPILAVVTESETVGFYQRQGFSSICQERYFPDEVGSVTKVPVLTIWLMWRESEASSLLGSAC